MSGAGFSVRLAGLDDFGPAAALYERVAQAAMPWMPTEMLSAEAFLEQAAEETVWVAVAGERVIGLAALYEPESFLHSLYVDHMWRGCGVGLALMEAAEARAAAPLSLKVEERNAQARRFYARHGFTEVKRGAANGSAWLRLARI